MNLAAAIFTGLAGAFAKWAIDFDNGYCAAAAVFFLILAIDARLEEASK